MKHSAALRNEIASRTGYSKRIIALMICLILLLSSCSTSRTDADTTYSGDGLQTAVTDTKRVADPNKTYTVGNREFTAGEIADYLSASYNHAMYYNNLMFYIDSATIEEYLKDGGKLRYDLYITEESISTYKENKIILVDIDGDTLPDFCGGEGCMLWNKFVLNENGVQSGKYDGSVIKKEEIKGSSYETDKSKSVYIGRYEYTYCGKPDEAMYVAVSAEKAKTLQTLLEENVNTEKTTFAKMPRGKYTVSIAPIFASDDDASVLLAYENGGVFSARWVSFNNVDENSHISLAELSYVDEYYLSDNLGNIKALKSDPACTFEIVKQ